MSENMDGFQQADAKPIQYVAVLGTGSIGMRHLRILQGLSHVTPIAIPCRSTRRKVLDQQGFITAENLGEAVRSWSVEACIVASDTARHVSDSLEVLTQGLNCLVEKPLARNGGEGLVLQQKVLELQGSLHVGCYLRFSESLSRLRTGLSRVGAIHSVRIECQSFLPDWRPDRPYRDSYSSRPDEGGVLRDLIHEIDYAGWMFGWPTALQARLGNTGSLGIAAEESADLSWQTKDGVIVTLRLDYLTRPPPQEYHSVWQPWDLDLGWHLKYGVIRECRKNQRAGHVGPNPRPDAHRPGKSFSGNKEGRAQSLSCVRDGWPSSNFYLRRCQAIVA